MKKATLLIILAIFSLTLAACEEKKQQAAPAPSPIVENITDTDNDGVADQSDNCPSIYNPDQADANANGIGDACEAPLDSDNDGVPDSQDNCPNLANPDQADSNANGIGDACEAVEPPAILLD